MKSYDYIIAGAGCAGLSLGMHLYRAGCLENKTLLIADKSFNKQNDRTWCFWEKGHGFFESIVHHSWKQLWFHSHDFSRLLDLSPYEYKMIRGIDFYQYCLHELQNAPNISFEEGEVRIVDSRKGDVMVNDQHFTSAYIFNSIPGLIEQNKKEYHLRQHFKGWLIKSERDCFDPSVATLMDFRVSQRQGTTFGYILPVARNRALVEYTLFSEDLLSDEQYEEGLRSYLEQMPEISSYTILEEEKGVIPMTNHRFAVSDGRVINIGTAGGLTRPSSGYTFYFIQQHAAKLAAAVKEGKDPASVEAGHKGRVAFFDSVLLNVLATGKVQGDKVFSDLFRSNSPERIIEFLNSESSILTDLRIISSLPTLPFLKAGLEELL